MQLTREQRWILANQYSTLERLDPENADYYGRNRAVLENGWELNYDWIAENIYDRTMSAEDCQEVLDILDMFQALERSYDGLVQNPDVEASQVRFTGFDGNNETKQLSYTQFLIEKEGKFASLADHVDGLDSHIPVLDTYRRMLAAWKQLPDEERHDMTAEGIAAVVGARAYPKE